MNINEITASTRQANEIIEDLSQKKINVISWDVLRKEYDARLHPVKTDPDYQDTMKNKKLDRKSRITIPFQKLAVKRMTELAFGIPVKRVYNKANENEQRKKAISIIEDIYRKNRIDAVNIERSQFLYAGCESCTIWYSQLQDTTYGGENTKVKLRCKNYSPVKGDELYPLFDEYDDMIALSVKYIRKENDGDVTYFDCYTADEHIRWKSTSNDYSEELREKINLQKIAGVYIHRKEPIWEDQSENVYELEWTLSRNGNYIAKNAKPNWVVFSDEDLEFGGEEQNTGRNVLQYSANSRAEYVTWSQSTESIKFHIEQITSNFFRALQLPDMSMETMKASPMSGEARKMMFIDAQLKVRDESGIWLDFLYREFNVIRAYAKMMFPKLSKAFDDLQVDIEITPYQISDETETIGNLASATGGKQIMSQETAIANLGYVDDVDAELKKIQDENNASLFNTPTE